MDKNIEYTSLNGLESQTLNAFFSSFPFFQYETVHLHGTQSSHIQPIFIQQTLYKNRNYSNTILSMNCIELVIMPKNHSCKTTVYQSLCITILSNGIHNKFQFFIHILVIPVALINSIPHATQNKTFHENGNNRIKHCVKPMK